jgi:tetratricopeptide (TPR) repeat protein/DNA-binding CsgD family transcriptional regulator
MKKLVYVLLLNLVFTTNLFSINNREKDSLDKLMKNATDKKKVDLLIAYSILYVGDTIIINQFLDSALLLAIDINYKIGIIEAFYQKGRRLEYNSNRQLKEFHKMLFYSKKFKLKDKIAKSLTFIGRTHLHLNNFDSSLFYQNLAGDYYQDLNDLIGLINVYDRKGMVYFHKGQYAKALNWFQKALVLSKRKNNRELIALSNYHIGITNMNLGNYEVAIENIYFSLKIYEDLDQICNIWNCHEIIGNTYLRTGDYQNALKNHRISLHLRQITARKNSIPDSLDLGIAYSYNNIAEVYKMTEDKDSALWYARQSYFIKKRRHHSNLIQDRDIANSALNLGEISFLNENYKNGILYTTEALALYKNESDKNGLIASYLNFAAIFKYQNKNLLSIKYSDSALILAKDIRAKEHLKNVYLLKSELYSAIHDFERSLNYFQLYSQTKDSLLNEHTNKKISELQIKYEVGKKELQIEQQSFALVQKQNRFRMTLIIGSLILAMALVIIVMIVQTKKHKEKILQQEKENLQKELELNNRDLVCNVSKIYTKNQVINKVARTLTKSTFNFKQANIGMIKDIIGELRQNIDETSWLEFETRFAKVHGNFYISLDLSFPDLSKTERKLCAMIKLGMSSKEIAALTSTSSKSVDTSRSRLRKKLGLKNEENLFHFLNSL